MAALPSALPEVTAEDSPMCTPLPLGGYDYQFVEPPPKQWECPICLLTLRAPHLLSCCGVKICQSCIDGVKNKGRPCPKCRKSEFITLLDKELERLIFDLVLHCPLSVSGCNWTGELRHLDKHMSPLQGGDCRYVEVECSHGCGQKMTRDNMAAHEKESCPKLPVEIQIRVLQERMERISTEMNKRHEAEVTALKTMIAEQEQEIQMLKAVVHNSIPKSEAHCITYAHLKKGALEVMPKLRGGAIPGVHYHASKGRVEIYGSTEEEVQARGFRFQLEYQRVILSMRVKYIELLPYTNEEELSIFLTELNQKFESVYLFKSLDGGQEAVKLISIVSSQLDDAMKAVEGKLKQLQVKKMFLASGRKVTLKIGDISMEDTEIIVSASNRALIQDGGAVSRALNRASNGELQKLTEKYVSDFGRLQIGDVAVTHSGGGNLKCKYVIHLVTPRSQGSGEQNAGDLIANGITKALTEAVKLHATSISIPAVGCGSFIIKNDVVAAAIYKAVNEFSYPESNLKTLKDIRIVIFSPSVYRVFAEHFK